MLFIEFFCFGVVVMLALRTNQPVGCYSGDGFPRPQHDLQNEQPVTPQNA